MFTFNNNHIFTGYLKQLLYNFNLPTYHNFSWTGIEDKDYYYNKPLLNGCRRFKIENNIYDSYTHEYLGDFLRFKRDYLGVNLMPLYNCFSNSKPEKLITSIYKDLDKKELLANFNTYDSAYNIYMLPVKLSGKWDEENKKWQVNSNYTIAIDSPFPIEMYCGLYGKYQIRAEKADKSQEYIDRLATQTYLKVPNIRFNQPILYTKLKNTTCSDDGYEEQSRYENFILANESDLKLFIKIPASIKSSIVVLEGNYTESNSKIFANKKILDNNYSLQIDDTTNEETEEQTMYSRINHSVINYENLDDISMLDKEVINNFYIPELSLLSQNTGESYPFANRLIEYLTGQAITAEEELLDNILRIQKVLKNGYPNESYDEGIWENKIQAQLYASLYKSDGFDFVYSNESLQNSRIDALGYVDKDIENNFYTINRSTETVEALSTVDIYPQIYLASKRGNN